MPAPELTTRESRRIPPAPETATKAQRARVLDAQPRSATSYAHYRAQADFDTLTGWLRSKGVIAMKPLHELRKEFGSQLCAKYGIYAASRMLRHADIRVTAQHYLDTKERTPIGLGNLLSMPKNVTPMSTDSRASTASAKRSSK